MAATVTLMSRDGTVRMAGYQTLGEIKEMHPVTPHDWAYLYLDSVMLAVGKDPEAPAPALAIALSDPASRAVFGVRQWALALYSSGRKETGHRERSKLFG